MNKEQGIQYLNGFGFDISNHQYLENQRRKVALGMSGGVDSSVTAVILKLMGYQVTGFFMKNWSSDEPNSKCTSEEDFKDVKLVAEKIGIDYYPVSFEKEYKERVFSHFLEEYKRGNTPNPDILCNREIKFDAFYDYLMSLNFDYIATGHYCQNLNIHGLNMLVKGKDANKDQTYFLYAIKGLVLKNTLFPIGHPEKSEVRQIAHDFELATATKKDSTGICFIGEKDFNNFLKKYIDQLHGNFVHIDTGRILGEHDGSCFYTRGQRKGLGLGGPGGPWFVVDKDLDKNIVYVAEGTDHPKLYNSRLEAVELTWISEKPSFPLECTAKIRHRQKDQKCIIEEKEDKLIVTFAEKQRAIAPRQSIVLYQKDICLGGGIINRYFD